MTIQKLRPTFTLTEDRLRHLQQVVPEAFADGKINWETLREALGEVLEDETQEHFGLTWPGKREARRLAALPPQGTLVPAPGEGVDEETTHNLFIEGENLEVLKLLQKSYAGRVKMIYIDPPYNTGNDFIYEDDYSEPLEAYLKRTGQMDEAGRRLTTNTRASGRFHSKWLSMIYPRLLLARQLLREDGVIFVSIDDNEVHNLRQVMNEVFGEENFVETFIWRSRLGKGATSKVTAKLHEYIVVYGKSKEQLDFLGDVRITATDKKERIRQWGQGDRREDRPTMYYPVFSEEFGWIYPKKPDGTDGRWRISKSEFEKLQQKGLVVFEKQPDGRVEAYRIIPAGTQTETAQDSILDTEKVKTTAFGSKEISTILEQNVFDYPKPTTLLCFLLELLNDKSALILDFFAGSCTTAHAVLAQNREDGGRRQFIMVQLPEPTPPDSEARKAGYATIADIGKERIRRVIRKMKEEQNGQLPLPAAEDGQPSPLDLGFKVLKLTRSHFKPWAPLPPTDAYTLDRLFEQNISPLVENWTKDGLLSEILLLEGFPLDSRVISLEGFGENALQRVHHAEVGHKLFVCLDKQIRPETVERLKAGEILGREDIFICLDSALTDEAKVVLDDRLRLKVI